MASLKKKAFYFFSSLNKRSEQGLVKLCGLGLNAQCVDHELTVLPQCWDDHVPLSHSCDHHFYCKAKIWRETHIQPLPIMKREILSYDMLCSVTRDKNSPAGK